METDEDQRVIPFQLQFDKPVASQVFLLSLFLFIFPTLRSIIDISLCLCVHFLIWRFVMADKDCGVESGEGFAGHGYGGLEDFAASFQLAEIVDDLSW